MLDAGIGLVRCNVTRNPSTFYSLLSPKQIRQHIIRSAVLLFALSLRYFHRNRETTKSHAWQTYCVSLGLLGTDAMHSRFNVDVREGSHIFY